MLQSARSRGVTRAVFYPLIWLANIKTKGFTSRKSFCRSGSQTLFFGGREATTGKRLLFAGYRFSRLLKFFRKIILLPYPVKTEIVVDRKDFSDESSLLGNIMCYVFSLHQHYIETPYKMNQTFKWISENNFKKWPDSGHNQVGWCKSTQIELKRRMKKDDDTW